MLKALEKYCDKIIPLGPLYKGYWSIIIGKIINKLSRVILKRKFAYMHSIFIAKEFARILKDKIKRDKCDILFFPVGSHLLAYLDVDIPIVYLSDTTFKLMLDYYPSFSGLLNISKKNGMSIEQRAIERASKVIYSSKWAAESAIRDYNCNEDKIHIIPFGANLDNIPSKEEVLLHRERSGSVCKLLFVGVDWFRKGGQIAFETMIELNRRSLNTELIICGGKPPKNLRHDKLRVIGFLDKNNKEQALKLYNFYKDSSFFLLPTRSECAGIVFCEAAAYALPVISTQTGGVPSYVKNAITGYLLPLEAKSHDYADIIQKIWSERNRYYALCENSRNKYENRLNWESWGKKVAEILREVKKK